MKIKSEVRFHVSYWQEVKKPIEFIFAMLFRANSYVENRVLIIKGLKRVFIYRPHGHRWKQSWRNVVHTHTHCHCTEGQHCSQKSLIFWLPCLEVIFRHTAGGGWYNGCSWTEHVSLCQTARVLLKIASSIAQLCHGVQSIIHLPLRLNQNILLGRNTLFSSWTLCQEWNQSHTVCTGVWLVCVRLDLY